MLMSKMIIILYYNNYIYIINSINNYNDNDHKVPILAAHLANSLQIALLLLIIMIIYILLIVLIIIMMIITYDIDQHMFLLLILLISHHLMILTFYFIYLVYL